MSYDSTINTDSLPVTRKELPVTQACIREENSLCRIQNSCLEQWNKEVVEHVAGDAIVPHVLPHHDGYVNT